MVKLGLNIDHVATVRQARGASEPNLLEAAYQGIKGGARGITVHLREDRRHIQDRDVFLLKKSISVPLNLEMSINEDIVQVALKVRPAKACLVPEKRQELTTEGGLDVTKKPKRLAGVIKRLKDAGIVVSLFIDPIKSHIQMVQSLGADFIELHTGTYANVCGQVELNRLKESALLAHSLGLGVNAGHGLNYENVRAVAKLPYIEELNIGHSIVSRALFVGMKKAVEEMNRLIKSI